MSEKKTLVDSVADEFSREQIDAFCSIVKVPDFMIAWLSRFFEPGEIAFVLELNQQRSLDMDAQAYSEWIQKNESNWPDEAIEMQALELSPLSMVGGQLRSGC